MGWPTHLSFERFCKRRWGIACALGLILVLSGMAGVACGSSGLKQVELDSGPITGERLKHDDVEIWVFRGVPYAPRPSATCAGNPLSRSSRGANQERVRPLGLLARSPAREGRSTSMS